MKAKKNTDRSESPLVDKNQAKHVLECSNTQYALGCTSPPLPPPFQQVTLPPNHRPFTNLPQSSQPQQILPPRCPFAHPKCIIQAHRRCHIEYNVRSHNTYVSPPCRPAHTDVRQVLVRCGQWAVLATGSGLRIEQLAWGSRREITCKVLAAALIGWGVENAEFVDRAGYGTVVEAGGEHA